MPHAKLFPMHYEDALPEVTLADDVYMVDYSLKRDAVIDLCNRVKRVTIVDHHKTAVEDLVSEPGNELPSNLTLILDQRVSGAVLAWQYFFPVDDVPLLLQHVGDRDLWLFKMKHTKEICAWFASYEMDTIQVTRCVDLLAANYDQVIMIGKALLRAQATSVAKTFYWTETVDEHKVAVANCTNNISETGQWLLDQVKDAHYSMTFMIHNEKTICSLRSKGDFDVSAIAKKRGGGGHKNAAGFTK
jgi:nanoRNase/pAp phosphatase (c-di-AMP/oligoRNAs hydrolase)